MIDAYASKTRAKAIDAGRITQWHLECLADCVARRKTDDDREGAEPSAAEIGSSYYFRELVDRLTFERWVELDMIAWGLAVQEPTSRRCAYASSGDKRVTGTKALMRSLPNFDVGGMAGMAIHRSVPLETEIRLMPDCPSCSLRSEPAAGRFKAAVAPRGGRSSLTSRGQARGLLRSKPAGPQTCPACSAGSDL
jgi:hypothetical protein